MRQLLLALVVPTILFAACGDAVTVADGSGGSQPGDDDGRGGEEATTCAFIEDQDWPPVVSDVTFTVRNERMDTVWFALPGVAAAVIGGRSSVFLWRGDERLVAANALERTRDDDCACVEDDVCLQSLVSVSAGPATDVVAIPPGESYTFRWDGHVGYNRIECEGEREICHQRVGATAGTYRLVVGLYEEVPNTFTATPPPDFTLDVPIEIPANTTALGVISPP